MTVATARSGADRLSYKSESAAGPTAHRDVLADAMFPGQSGIIFLAVDQLPPLVVMGAEPLPAAAPAAAD